MVNPKSETLLLKALSHQDNHKDAIVFKKQRVSYHKLEDSVARLMTYLRSNGVSEGDRVAVWLKKSPESVMLMLAVMGVGAAYIPIDPGAPDARVQLLLDDSQPVLLFTGEEKRDQPVLSQGKADSWSTVLLKGLATGYDISQLIAGLAHGDLAEIRENDLAAILYTSGSTGTPKGVMLSHGNISNFVGWAVQTFALSATDRVTSHAPFHFDLSTFDLYATFHAGGTVYLLDEVSIKFPGAIAKLLQDEEISVWYSVPTALRMLVERGGILDRNLKRLRLVLFAGEVFHPHALRSVMAAFPDATFINLYGPTETNVCTYYEVPRPLPQDISAIPVGIPCPPLEVQICDENSRSMPEGEQGEICVMGPAVMLGYWNDAQKTAQVRLKDRSNSYRTGDFGYVMPDGNIMFSGRKDSQVKFRGHRIELQEIEANISSYSKIEEAVAIVVSNENEEQILRVFAVTHSTDQLPEPAEIKKHIAVKLPVYCIPDEVFVVEDLPRTSTGKIDRSLLKKGDF
jgi:amino acid adenylation domain-containing protein